MHADFCMKFCTTVTQFNYIRKWQNYAVWTKTKSPFLSVRASCRTASELYWVRWNIWVTISSDLSLQRHVSNVSATSFYWFRQLRRVRRSLDSESAATLVHAFVTSHVHQCNAILAGATKSVTDTLQRVMNAAARTCCQWHKKVWPCMAWPEFCTMTYTGSMWQIESHTNLASSCIDVGMARLHGISLTVAHRSPMLSVGSDWGQQHSNWWWCHDTGSPRLAAEHFAVHGPMVWNSLPDDLRAQQDYVTFKQGLKTWLFSRY